MRARGYRAVVTAAALLACSSGTRAAVTRAELEAAAQNALPQAVADLRAWVRMPSITQPDDAHRPDKTAVLEAVIARAQSLGLRARLLAGGEVAIVEVAGPEPALGVLVHADVVPAGDLTQWRYPPFSAELADGAVWGRGAADDKGPLVAMLYAMAIAQQQNLQMSRGVRLIVGSSEENLDWRDLDVLTGNGLVPPDGFAADAAFPVIHAEKSFLDARLEFAGAAPDPVIESLSGGTAPNAVPDSASATLRSADPERLATLLARAVVLHNAVYPQVKFSVTQEGAALVLHARGRAAHGSRPQEGVNALAHLTVLLHGGQKTLGISPESAVGKALAFLGQRVGLSTDGGRLGLATTHAVMGTTTVNLGVLDSTATRVSMDLNIRLPVGMDLATQRGHLADAAAPFGGEITRANGMEAQWVDPQAPLVQKLLRVYRTMTDEPGAQPISIGGTTYAKAFPGFVAFGMGFPGSAGVAHAPDERLSVQHLEKGIAIYAAALLDLTKPEDTPPAPVPASVVAPGPALDQ